MRQEIEISKTEFNSFYEPIIKSYNKDFIFLFEEHQKLLDLLFGKLAKVTIQDLYNFINSSKNNFLNAYLYRLIGIREIIYCRENKFDLSIKDVWEWIKNSIILIPDQIISTIGSQGFLSIPLYKYESGDDKSRFDFIRLHIWDDSLDEYMDLEKNKDFSIHTHTFFAQSWILTGSVINNTFDYEINSENSQYSFFKIQYNDSLNEVNQHTSVAVNEEIDVELQQTSKEIHFAKGYYFVKQGKLHQSGHLSSPEASATFFSFTGKDGLTNSSIVIGPKSIKLSEINRKVNISPIKLLEKIDLQIKKNINHE